MDSSNSSLLQNDQLSSLRKRNKILIISFFSSIILLALITGGIIISVVGKINSKSPDPNPAIREFCFPSALHSSCIKLVSSEIEAPPDANPNHIFFLSLEASLTKIAYIISIGARAELDSGRCSSSLSHAAGQLNSILEIVRVDSDLQTYGRGNMTAWITAAAEDVAACMGGLGKAESAEVEDVAALVDYSKEFLVNCDVVNEEFRWSSVSDRNSRDEIVENLITVSLFGSQYFVLAFLFCLLLRICYG